MKQVVTHHIAALENLNLVIPLFQILELTDPENQQDDDQSTSIVNLRIQTQNGRDRRKSFGARGGVPKELDSPEHKWLAIRDDIQPRAYGVYNSV